MYVSFSRLFCQSAQNKDSNSIFRRNDIFRCVHVQLPISFCTATYWNSLSGVLLYWRNKKCSKISSCAHQYSDQIKINFQLQFHKSHVYISMERKIRTFNVNKKKKNKTTLHSRQINVLRTLLKYVEKIFIKN